MCKLKVITELNCIIQASSCFFFFYSTKPTSPHPGPPDSITSIADQSSQARQAQSLTQELQMDKDITNLPDVPSDSPSKTGTLETRQKTIHLY